MGTRGGTALVVAALVAGCGGGEESPFGDVAQADRTRYADVNNHIGRFSFENADWIEAAQNANVKRARREVDGARDAIDDARAVVDRIENDELRSRLGDYVATLERYVAAADRLTAAAERPEPPDRQTEDRLVSGVEAAAGRVRREEQEFARFLTQDLSELQLDELRARIE